MGSTPGASVRAEYQRRRRRAWFVLFLVVPFAVAAGVDAGARWLWVAACCVLVAVASAGRRRVARYRAGALGEEAVAAVLAPLERRGFTVLHDLAMPGRRENIDHLVIGPSGICVVETKRWAGEVTVGWRLRQNGQDRMGAVAQVQRQADAVSTTLGVEVRPIVCIHGARVRRRWFRRRAVIRGVVVVQPRQLLEHVSLARRRLKRREMGRLVDLALERFAPAAAGRR